MNIYDKKSQWKWYLAIAGVVIIVISMVYTNYVASKLADEERRKIQVWLTALERLPELDPNCDFTLHNAVLTSNETVPMMLVSETGLVDDARNYGTKRDGDKEFLQERLASYIASGKQPLVGGSQLVYYEDSTLLTLLKYFPLIQILLIGLFIAFGYFAFSSARRSEQNQVWAGMAKETAHQLGTPISAIIGWIEHLKLMWEGNEASQEVLMELTNDVKRLDLIADRFSKIGSAPTLEPINIYDQLEVCRNYMQRRSPRRVVFEFPEAGQEEKMVEINKHLFDWVIENLLRNALDSM
ncbi:MAG: signal transduction histidine kinase, partial [Flavobacteriales bacterium]